MRGLILHRRLLYLCLGGGIRKAGYGGGLEGRPTRRPLALAGNAKRETGGGFELAS